MCVAAHVRALCFCLLIPYGDCQPTARLLADVYMREPSGYETFGVLFRRNLLWRTANRDNLHVKPRLDHTLPYLSIRSTNDEQRMFESVDHEGDRAVELLTQLNRSKDKTLAVSKVVSLRAASENTVSPGTMYA
jgi:hypothetical protein